MRLVICAKVVDSPFSLSVAHSIIYVPHGGGVPCPYTLLSKNVLILCNYALNYAILTAYCRILLVMLYLCPVFYAIWCRFSSATAKICLKKNISPWHILAVEIKTKIKVDCYFILRYGCISLINQ